MRRIVAACLIAIPVACAPAGPRPATSPTPAPVDTASETLYRRLGGYDAIAAVTDSFLARMVADRQLGKYFTGLSLNSRERLRQHLIDFICFYAKGPCLYVGRDLIESHTGLNITADEWNVAVRHLQATLTEFNVGAREQQELIDVMATFRDDVIDR